VASHRRGQRNVAQTLATYFALNNLNTAFFANNATVLHALVLTAVTLVILDRTKNLGAEQAVPLRFECPIVDCLRLLYLTIGPLQDFLGGGQSNAASAKGRGIYRLLKEIEYIFQFGLLS